MDLVWYLDYLWNRFSLGENILGQLFSLFIGSLKILLPRKLCGIYPYPYSYIGMWIISRECSIKLPSNRILERCWKLIPNPHSQIYFRACNFHPISTCPICSCFNDELFLQPEPHNEQYNSFKWFHLRWSNNWVQPTITGLALLLFWHVPKQCKSVWLPLSLWRYNKALCVLPCPFRTWI